MVNHNSCSSILGTTRDETTSILVQARNWIYPLVDDHPKKASELEDLQTRLSSVLPSPNSTSHRFWTSILKVVYSRASPYTSSPDCPSNFPPALLYFFVQAPELSPEPAEWKGVVDLFITSNSTWWNQDGTPNASRNITKDDSQSRSRSSSRHPEDEIPAVDGSGQGERDKGKGKEKDDGNSPQPIPALKIKLDEQVARTLANQLAPRSARTNANAVASLSRVQIQGSGGGGGGGGGDDDDSSGGGGSRKPIKNPRKRDRTPQLELSDEEEEEDVSFEAIHGPVDETVRLAFIQGRKALCQLNQSRQDPHLAATSSIMREASNVSRRDALFELAQTGQNLPDEVALAVYYNNKPWDLEKVHEYDSGSTDTVGRLHEDLDGKALLETTKVAKRNKIRSGYQWQAAWKRCSIVASCLYPHRTDEFIQYSDYIAGLIDGNPNHLELVLQFDVAFRSQVGSPGHVTRLDDVRHEQQLLSQHLYGNPQYLKFQLGGGGSRSATSGGGGASSSKKKSKKVSSNDPCKNWNAKKGSCSGNGDCQNGRKHVCDHEGCTQSHRSSDHHR